MSVDQIIHAQMRSLVQKFGCYEAVAETLSARWGDGHSKGTVSRKMNGTLDWTIKDAVATEDALGEYPVTRTLERRRAVASVSGSEGLSSLAGHVSRETGEAVQAILSAEQSTRAGDVAVAIRESEEAKEALERALERLYAVNRARNVRSAS